MQHFKVILIFSLLINSTVASATKYYVSSSRTGSNVARDGKSEATAWKTISEVNGKTFLPGDSVLFRKGDIWRETLIVPSTGKANGYIVFSTFGTGNKPKILGSLQIISWVSQGSKIWKSSVTVDDPYAKKYKSEIFFTEPDGSVRWGNKRKTGMELLANEYDWTWISGYIYIYSETDPGKRYPAVEIPQRDYCITLNDMQYITIEGIEVRFARYSGIDSHGTRTNADLKGLTIKNCNASYFGTKNGIGYGIDVVFSLMLISNNTIHDCGRRSISLYNYGTGIFSDIIIENNTLYNGFHTTGIDISVGLKRQGHFKNIVIRNNLIYDDPDKSVTAPEGSESEFIFLQNYNGSNSTFSNILICNNVFKYPSMAAIHFENIDSPSVFNNTFIGHNELKKGNTFHIFIDNGTSNAAIKNNIFYTTLSYATLGSGICVYSLADPSVIDCDNNLYYRTSDNLRIAQINSTEYFRTRSSWSEYKTATGWETHSPAPADPEFISASDYRLKAGSPAIGAGVNVGLTSDFNKKFYNNPPSIGAFEGNPAASPAIRDSVIIPSPIPKNGHINILREGPAKESVAVRIYSLSGRSVFSDAIMTGVKNVCFSLKLSPGIYILQILSVKRKILAQSLFVLI